MRRSLLWFAGVFAIGCSAGKSNPADLSNATLESSATVESRPRGTTMNTHVIREIDFVPGPVRAALSAPDRLPEDRARDEPRQIADVLAFLGVAPGMRVAELGSGAGYTTELLARVVGPGGVVFAQNTPGLLASTGIEDALESRLARPANAKVVRVDRGFDTPLPSDVRDLDLVYLALFYRDLPSLGVDRGAVNRAVYHGLRHGGRYAVLDRTPSEGTFVTDLSKLHVAESRNVRREVEAAGFQLLSEGRFLRAPDELNAKSAENAGNESARFFLVFRKPY